MYFWLDFLVRLVIRNLFLLSIALMQTLIMLENLHKARNVSLNKKITLNNPKLPKNRDQNSLHHKFILQTHKIPSLSLIQRQDIDNTIRIVYQFQVGLPGFIPFLYHITFSDRYKQRNKQMSLYGNRRVTS